MDAIACTHACLPVFQALHMPRARPTGRAARWILNNGAAGMPNFRGVTAGLLTRIALAPSARPFAGAERHFGVAMGAEVVAEAIAIDIDAEAWRTRFPSKWPAGSEAHVSSLDRMVQGPGYGPAKAVRVDD